VIVTGASSYNGQESFSNVNCHVMMKFHLHTIRCCGYAGLKPKLFQAKQLTYIPIVTWELQTQLKICLRLAQGVLVWCEPSVGLLLVFLFKIGW